MELELAQLFAFHVHFCTMWDAMAQGHFCTAIVRHCGRFSMGTFWQWDISALWIILHLDISAPYQNVSVPKCPYRCAWY